MGGKTPDHGLYTKLQSIFNKPLILQSLVITKKGIQEQDQITYIGIECVFSSTPFSKLVQQLEELF